MPCAASAPMTSALRPSVGEGWSGIGSSTPCRLVRDTPALEPVVHGPQDESDDPTGRRAPPCDNGSSTAAESGFGPVAGSRACRAGPARLRAWLRSRLRAARRRPSASTRRSISDCAQRRTRAGRARRSSRTGRRRLRPATRGARRAARRRSRARVLTAGGLQGFVFYAAVQLARSRAGCSSRPDVRPTAEDARRGRCRGRVAADGRRGARPRRARGGAAKGGEISFLYTIPTFQNPSGRTLGTDRRRRLAELAAEHGLTSSRTTRTVASGTRASRRRWSTSSRAASGSRSRRRSRRPSRRASERATSSFRSRSYPSTTIAPSPPTSRRASCRRRSCTSSCSAGTSSRTSSACAGC